MSFNIGAGKLHSGALVAGGVGGVEVCIGVVADELAAVHWDLLGEGLERGRVYDGDLKVHCLACIKCEIDLVGCVTVI